MKIETIDEAYRRLICKALNKYGTVEKAHPYLSPSGVPTVRSVYNIKSRLKIKKNTQGVYV